MTSDPFDLCGRKLDHFQILGFLGAGGFGVLYEALNTRLQRPAALKVLRPQDAESTEAIERFMHEARVLASFDHSHIARIYSTDHEAGYHYIEMELVEGQSLAELIQESPSGLAEEKAVEIAAQVADALVVAHDSAHVLHRDIKPSNVLIDPQGTVKLVDFGLAKPLSQEEIKGAGKDRGYFLGTPFYASPEQCRGERLDAHSDLYSFGALLYHALSGRLPVGPKPVECDQEYLQRIVVEAPVPLEEVAPDVDPKLAHLVMTMLAKDPSDRYQSARVVRYELRALNEGLPEAEEVGCETTRRVPPPPVEKADQRAKRQKLRGILLVGLAMLVFLGGTWLWQHTRWDKALNVPSEFDTIQAAIDAAEDGDTVVISPGTYAGNINFKGKAITVTGEAPDDRSVVEATILDGERAGSVVIFADGETGESVLTGLTIQRGYPNEFGGGIICDGASPTISKNLIKGNKAYRGAGMWCRDSEARIIENIFKENTAKHRGGGIFCQGQPGPLIRDNTFVKNTVDIDRGGAIHCARSDATIEKNLIQGNKAPLHGGGISFYGRCNPLAKANTITENSARMGGGICSDADASPVIKGNTIADNVGGDGGGIICWKSSTTPKILNNDIVNNHSYRYGGGGIVCNNGTSPVIKGNRIEGNTSVNPGGGISCMRGASPLIEDNALLNNSASTGGGVKCWNDSSPRIVNNVIRANRANHVPESGEFAHAKTEWVGGGGIACEEWSCPEILRNEITENVGVYGAGIYCWDKSSPTIRENRIYRNRADHGGGIAVHQSARVDDSSGEEEADPLFVRHNRIRDNTGGGILVKTGNGVCLSSNVLLHNGEFEIDLNADGFTKNDPGDSDHGPNRLQNFPTLTTVSPDGSQLGVTSNLRSAPGKMYRVEFYYNPCGCGPGGVPVGHMTVSTDHEGRTQFGTRLPIGLSPLSTITATATDPQHNTSEFSPRVLVAPRFTAGR